MKPGKASSTAALVCVARAIAHHEGRVPGFSDPTASSLLSAEDRAAFDAYRAGPPADMRARFNHEFMTARATMMAIRTVVVDEAMRAAASPQVVILGAGLDGRAWRMPELENAVVFEVDHPDTQREKRARVGALGQRARDVRFVDVDFTKDDLDARLAAAGHDPTQPTTWIWEGVVMYLTPAEVETSLRVIQARSAKGSRLVIVYIGRGGWVVPIVAMVVRRLGEPFRSRFSAAEMAKLLARHGFRVKSDETLYESAARFAPEIQKAARRVKHLRTVIADV